MSSGLSESTLLTGECHNCGLRIVHLPSNVRLFRCPSCRFRLAVSNLVLRQPIVDGHLTCAKCKLLTWVYPGSEILSCGGCGAIIFIDYEEGKSNEAE